MNTVHYYIVVDYGILSPCRMTLLKNDGDSACVVREYRYDARAVGRVLTDAEYYEELERLAGDMPVFGVLVNQSVASFAALIDRHKRFRVFRSEEALWQAFNEGDRP